MIGKRRILMKLLYSKLVFIIFIISVVLFSGCSTVKKEWITTQQINTVQAYDNFIKKYPSAPQVQKAKQSIESIAWDEALAKDSVDGYEQFLINYPNGANASLANEKLESIAWDEAKHIHTYLAYSRFISKYPKSSHAMEAKARIDSLEWNRILQSDRISSYYHYIKSAREGSIIGSFIEQAYRRMENKLEQAHSASDMLNIEGEIRKRIVPFSIDDLYGECRRADQSGFSITQTEKKFSGGGSILLQTIHKEEVSVFRKANRDSPNKYILSLIFTPYLFNVDSFGCNRLKLNEPIGGKYEFIWYKGQWIPF
jgi:outer membrane protein assembly factor BamD (BamD/ComL family)